MSYIYYFTIFRLECIGINMHAKLCIAYTGINTLNRIHRSEVSADTNEKSIL
jgi:hypothetical protein